MGSVGLQLQLCNSMQMAGVRVSSQAAAGTTAFPGQLPSSLAGESSILSSRSQLMRTALPCFMTPGMLSTPPAAFARPKVSAIPEVFTDHVVRDRNVDFKLPLEDSSFDVVTNSVSMDYLTKKLPLFKDMNRVLKPGGLPLMSFSNRSDHVCIVGSYFHYPGGYEPPQKKTTTANNLLYKILKISAASVIYSLKRKQREVLEIRFPRRLSTGYRWRTSTLARFFRYTSSLRTTAGAELFLHQLRRRQGVGAIRSSSSEYYNSYSGVSSQAEDGSLDNATMVDQQQRFSPDGETVEFLATGYGWRVRDAVIGDLQELIRVADIQTGAFHERSAIFDDLFYKIFHAEVLSSLQYKARHSAPDRYSCLLAESDPSELFSLEEMQYEGGKQTIVGAVDVTALTEGDIVRHLPGADEYLYVSGMAVDSNFRRRSVATLLLEACLAQAIKWGFHYLVLHAYEDDFIARTLYSRAGYYVIAADPDWMTKFLGRRRRVVMAKRTHDILDSN